MAFVWVSMPHVSADIMGVLHDHIAILTPARVLDKRADNFGLGFLAGPAMINLLLWDQRLKPGLQPIALAWIRAFSEVPGYGANQAHTLFGFGSWLANSVSQRKVLWVNDFFITPPPPHDFRYDSHNYERFQAHAP